MARVIKVSAANRDYDAKDDADKDTHDENSWFPTSNAAGDGEFPTLLRGAPQAIVTAKQSVFWGTRR